MRTFSACRSSGCRPVVGRVRYRTGHGRALGPPVACDEVDIAGRDRVQEHRIQEGPRTGAIPPRVRLCQGIGSSAGAEVNHYAAGTSDPRFINEPPRTEYTVDIRLTSDGAWRAGMCMVCGRQEAPRRSFRPWRRPRTAPFMGQPASTAWSQAQTGSPASPRACRHPGIRGAADADGPTLQPRRE